MLAYPLVDVGGISACMCNMFRNLVDTVSREERREEANNKGERRSTKGISRCPSNRSNENGYRRFLAKTLEKQPPGSYICPF